MPTPRRTPDLNLEGYVDGVGTVFGVHVLKAHGALHLTGKIMKGAPGDWLICDGTTAFIIPPEAGAALLSPDNTKDDQVNGIAPPGPGYEDAVYFV